jgi:hypothetical protein
MAKGLRIKGNRDLTISPMRCRLPEQKTSSLASSFAYVATHSQGLAQNHLD